MTHDADRVAIRANGQTPPPSGKTTRDDGGEPIDSADDEVPTAAFTPTQLTVGFGILAALILLLVRRRRGKP